MWLRTQTLYMRALSPLPGRRIADRDRQAAGPRGLGEQPRQRREIDTPADVRIPLRRAQQREHQRGAPAVIPAPAQEGRQARHLGADDALAAAVKAPAQ